MAYITSQPPQVNTNSGNPQLRISNFRLCRKNTLHAFFDVTMPSSMVICGCSLHENSGKWWVGLPGRNYKTPDGKETWAKVVSFSDRPASERFQAVVTPLAREVLAEMQQACA